MPQRNEGEHGRGKGRHNCIHPIPNPNHSLLAKDSITNALPLQLTPTDAIRIQRELKRRGCPPAAAERHGRMFPAQYGSPLQMLRRTAAAAAPSPPCGSRQQDRRSRTPVVSSVSPSFVRVEPCMGRGPRNSKGYMDTTTLPPTKTMRPPPFPSIAARLENDIALGLAASLWDSGTVVGHCDDRLAHLLVLSTSVVQSVQAEAQSGKGECAPLQLREAFMSLIEYLVYMDCVAAHALLRTSSKPPEGEDSEQTHQWVKCTEGDFVHQRVGEVKIPSVYFNAAVAGATRVLKGLLEPKTLREPTLSSAWQYSLVRTAADVPNRYAILDAMVYVLQPCRNLTVRRTFCAVARQLALDILRTTGDGSVGTRGAAAALRILQYINGRSTYLTVEEREAARQLLTTLRHQEQRLTALMSPEIVHEATQPIRELIRDVRIFSGTLERDGTL